MSQRPIVPHLRKWDTWRQNIKNMRIKYHLEKYSGRSSRHECPSCGDQQSLVRYIDSNTGEYIASNVGRCNHESSCGYHYSPKQYFEDNPQKKASPTFSPMPIQEHKKLQNPGIIPTQYLLNSLGYESNFIAFLCSIFDTGTIERPTITRLMQDYYLGQTSNREIIFWQIDINRCVRTGKIMQYDPRTGKRLKNTSGAIHWVHANLKKDNTLPNNFNLVQCLFGEHLLQRYPTKVAALVESEKSAIIGAGVFPEYIWLATGGKSQLSKEKLQVLEGRTVIMFPDADGYDLWLTKAEALKTIGCMTIVSDILELHTTPEEREAKIDIADWLIQDLQLSSSIAK